jgi:hypothetical protein
MNNNMNIRLKADIEEAIQNVINKHCERGDISWENYIHPTLIRQMADAAEVVFDSAQDAQDYYKKNES